MDVLIKKQALKEQGFTMGVMMNKLPVAGDIGIEIEVEGAKLPKTDEMLPWIYHQDNSLRGEDNAEYVLREPIKFEAVPGAIDTLWNLFDKKKSRLDDSNRTSVHLHLNCQKFHFNRLTAFMALYFCLEEVLTEWCGDHRVGNLFCLRAKDAPAIVSQIRRFIKTSGQIEIRDNHHYAGLNANALNKFGSIEIRSLRGVTDKQVILDWVSIIQRLYLLSDEYKDPREICASFSGAGPSEFFNNILGETADIVRKGVNMTEDDIRDSLYEGIRLAQDLCYCRDWSLFDPQEMVQDPFGRRQKKAPMTFGASIAEAQLQAQLAAIGQDYNGGGLIAPAPFTIQTISTSDPWAILPPAQPVPMPEPVVDEEGVYTDPDSGVSYAVQYDVEGEPYYTDEDGYTTYI